MPSAISPSESDPAVTTRPMKTGRKTKAPAGFDAWTWRPAVSVPAVDCEVTLQSVFAQKLLNTLFGRLQIALYGMAVTIPILERDRGDTVGKLHAVFEQSHRHLLSVQQQSADRYRQWLERVAAVPTIRYQAETRQFPVFCPNANRALAHFRLADALIQQLDQLWYATVIDALQHKRAVLETCAQVKNFARDMDGLWVRSKAAVLRAQRYQTGDGSAPAQPSASDLEPSLNEQALDPFAGSANGLESSSPLPLPDWLAETRGSMAA